MFLSKETSIVIVMVILVGKVKNVYLPAEIGSMVSWVYLKLTE